MKLYSNVCIDGNTSIGEATQIFPFVTIGYVPQDLKYNGEHSKVIIGTNNTIREHVTIHLGTQKGGMLTKIGNNCLLMVGSHIAHDCIVGNNVIMANNATLAGHVVIGDYAIIGGLSAIHQFVRVGHNAILGGVSALVQDLIPYGSAKGARATLESINIVGMKRRGFDRQIIQTVLKAFKYLFASSDYTFTKRLEDVKKQYTNNRCILEIISFLESPSTRNTCMMLNKK